MTIQTTTIPHTAYRSVYSSAVLTLCAACAESGTYPIGEEVATYLSDDPAICAGCGLLYDARRAQQEDTRARQAIERCAAHRPEHTQDRPYDGIERDGNPMATGALTVIDTCRCGAERRRNVNGCHSAAGQWV